MMSSLLPLAALGTLLLQRGALAKLRRSPPDFQGDASGESPASVLSGDAPCKPTRRELSKLHVRNTHASDGLPAVRFFVWRSEKVDFHEKYVTCFHRQLSSAGLDLDVAPETAEHMSDAAILSSLMSHPNRVNRSQDAQLIVLGEPLLSSYYATLLDTANESCGRGDYHSDRDALADELHQQRAVWKEKRVLAIATDWRLHDALGPRILSWMRRTGAVLAAVDHFIPSHRGKITNTVIIPYRTHFLSELGAQGLPLNVPAELAWGGSLSWAPSLNRELTFTFHGRMERRDAGAERNLLLNLTDDLQNTSVHGFTRNLHSEESVIDAAVGTAHAMLKSVFCLIPAGDTPSTRRLFDALAAGCVPIIFQDINSIADNLPFRNTIDWSQIAIFAGSLECTEENLDVSKRWLASLLTYIDNLNAIVHMRKKLHDAYTKYLSVTHGEFLATALLNEFTEEGNLVHPGLYFYDADEDE